MNAVRIAVGTATAALAVAGLLSHLSAPERAALLAEARAALGASSPSGLASASAPGRGPAPAAGRVVAEADRRGGFAEAVAADAVGQFHATIEAQGIRLPVLVDTGATFVALSYEDAGRLGLRPAPSDFRLPVGTANGRTFAAAVTLPSVRLGGIEVRDVPAIVAGRGQLGTSLLGMSFLSRLSSVRVERGVLSLTP